MLELKLKLDVASIQESHASGGLCQLATRCRHCTDLPTLHCLGIIRREYPTTEQQQFATIARIQFLVISGARPGLSNERVASNTKLFSSGQMSVLAMTNKEGVLADRQPLRIL
jgi:hypothetical protein